MLITLRVQRVNCYDSIVAVFLCSSLRSIEPLVLG